VAKRTTAEIYQAARAAGLSVPSAVIATAVALAESGGDDAILGDTSIQTGTWGPSVGIWQIRTVKSEYGTGSDRDLLALKGNIARQAQAMRNISSGGTNWTPWTVYTRGTYQQFLGQAQGVAGGAATSGGVQQLGLPGNGVIGDTADRALEATRDLLVKLGAAGLGVALLGIGLVVAVRARVVAQEAKAKQALTGMGGG
jgi:hypothetical protein